MPSTNETLGEGRNIQGSTTESEEQTSAVESATRKGTGHGCVEHGKTQDVGDAEETIELQNVLRHMQR